MLILFILVLVILKLLILCQNFPIIQEIRKLLDELSEANCSSFVVPEMVVN